MVQTISQWLAPILVVAQIFVMSGGRYRAGWWLCIATCLVWSYVALTAHLYGLLGQQIVLAILSFRGLLRLGRHDQRLQGPSGRPVRTRDGT
jgi:hypothetical protein